MDPATLAELAAVITDTLPGSRLAVEGVGEGATGDHFVAEPDYIHAWVGADNHVAPRSSLLDRPAVKMLIRNSELSSAAMMAVLAPAVGDLADLTYSHPRGLVEISPAGVTKATGLAEVARRLEIAAADVVAFGDMPNDLEMLRWAGHGVAMGLSLIHI